MSDEPDNLISIFLRRLDGKMDRLGEQMSDVRQRLTTLEVQVGHLASTEASHYGTVSMRLDQMDSRLSLIERRLDLAQA